MIYLKLDTEKEGQSIILYDKNGKLLAKVGSKDGYTLPYTGSLDIPLIRAIIDAEDKRFFFHHGVDMVAKVSSIWTNIQAHETLR
jgi:membrane carboxypeptidase/penicillin-binding protein PbpC